MNSPLGKYSQTVAAITAILITVAYLASALAGLPGNSNLHDAFLIALGAVFGSAAGVNGWHSEAAAIHTRLDAMGLPAAASGQVAA